MTYPKLSPADHKLRRDLIKGKNGPRMTAKEAFDFVVGKALDRQMGGKNAK